MALVCKKCGYKQTDEETLRELNKRFPELEEHDIPYYCGACMNEAGEQEYIDMEQEMCRLEQPFCRNESKGYIDCPYAGDKE